MIEYTDIPANLFKKFVVYIETNIFIIIILIIVFVVAII